MNNPLDIEFKLFNPELKKFGLPQYETTEAAALDVRAMTTEKEVSIPSGMSVKFGIGFGFHINNPFVAALVMPRSSTGKKGLILKNTIGLIDSDYQGEVICNVANINPEGSDPVVIKRGDRLFQLMFVPIVRADAKWVEEFGEKSDRGEGGFGSTGAS